MASPHHPDQVIGTLPKRQADGPGRAGITSDMVRTSLQKGAVADWGSLMAAATLAMLPTVVFMLFVQKPMVYGAAAGSVKG